MCEILSLPFLLSTCCHFFISSYCTATRPSYSSAIWEESNCGTELSLYYHAVPLLISRKGKEREERRGTKQSKTWTIPTSNIETLTNPPLHHPCLSLRNDTKMTQLEADIQYLMALRPGGLSRPPLIGSPHISHSSENWPFKKVQFLHCSFSWKSWNGRFKIPLNKKSKIKWEKKLWRSMEEEEENRNCWSKSIHIMIWV